jgi:hypothetical protein
MHEAVAPSGTAHGAPAAVFPALQGAPPLPQLLLSGLPYLMEQYNQGALGAAAAAREEEQQALARCLLPAPGINVSQGWLGADGSLWWAPPKSAAFSRLQEQRFCQLYHGSWAGLAIGESWRGTVHMLVPCGLQHCSQQQQQQQQQPCAGHDMPGHWRVATSTTGTLSCRRNKQSAEIVLYSSPLAQQWEPLAADHFLLRARLTQVGVG